MNFHKTIGFLATLLLVFGLGVPDSFAATTQTVTKVTLSGVSPTTLRDSSTANVTVRYTVGVTLASAVTVSDGESVIVVVDDTNSDSSLPYNGIDAKNVTVNIGNGKTSGSTTIAITNSNALEFDFLDGPPKGDADTVDDTVTITATLAAEQHGGTSVVTSNKVKILVTDHAAQLTNNAISVQGFKVRITTPGKDKWASSGKDKIKVRLFRHGVVGKEFGSFTSIKVALHNDANGAKADANEQNNPELYSMTLNNQVRLGSLAIPRVRTATLASDERGGSGTLNAANTKAFYTRRSGSNGFDVLEFRFHPTSNTAVSGDYVYAVVTFGLTGADNAKNTIESRDTETTIFDHANFANEKVGDGVHIKIDASAPANNIVTALTVSIDGTTVTDDSATKYAGIGDKLKISATIANFTEHTLQFQIIGTEERTFPAPTSENADATRRVTKADQPLVGYSKSFDNLAVLGKVTSGDPVTDEIKVASGQFKRKAEVAAHPDGKTFKKNGTYQDDNVKVKVRAIVKDKAGNATPQTTLSGEFFLDSRPPKVTVEYPKPSVADSARFVNKPTQSFANTQNLFNLSSVTVTNALRVKSDEVIDHVNTMGADTDSILVIIGAGATVDTLIGPAHKITEGTNIGFLTIGTAQTPLYYDLSTFKWTNKRTTAPKNTKNAVEDAGQGGKEVDVKVVTKDLAGNKGIASFRAIFDGKAPKVSELFPSNSALADYDNKIGDGTQHPIFRINEMADSILVRYDGDSGTHSVAGTAAQLKVVNQNINVMFEGKDDSLRQGSVYQLQVYVRDLAGNVGVSGLQENLEFDNAVNNPDAGKFKIATEVRSSLNTAKAAGFAAKDSVVAGQAMRLTITALDTMLTRTAKADRPAVTYNNAGVKVIAMDSGGNMVPGVTFWGGGVTNNGNGSATLDSKGWAVGKRNVFMKSTKAGSFTIAAKELNADGVATIAGDTSIVVDAADFSKFMLTAEEDGEVVKQVWGNFTFKVLPVDRFNNASLKAYKKKPDTKLADRTTANTSDSLDVLSTRKSKHHNYKEVDVTLRSLPSIGLPPFEWTIELADAFTRSFPVKAPADAKQIAIQVRVDNTSLVGQGTGTDGDTRSANIKTNTVLTVTEPLMVSMTLWVPGQEGDQTGNTVNIPAGGEVTVTARAEGFNEGDMVTFTKDGTAMDPVAADADGYAGLMITLSGSGTVSVKASLGQYSASVDIVHEEQEGRVKYVDADGNAVYLITSENMTVDSMDYAAFIAAWGSSEGDAKYNAQADVNDDGIVNSVDYALFIATWGKTATGPATKPLVLLPGVNENAEFALSLGSERVVAGELVAVDVSLANVEALMAYGFTLNYDATKFEFVSVAPADEDLLKSTGGETPLFHHVPGNGQVEVVNGIVNGTAVSGGGDIARFVFRVLYEFEDNARFEIANGLVFDPSQLSNLAVVAGVLELQSTPREFALHQNFPNPFNPDTTIKYDLAESADVTLQIYNVLGQVVRTLVASEAQNAGRYQIRWNGMDERGVPVSSGIYFYQIAADGKFSDVRKLMLLK